MTVARLYESTVYYCGPCNKWYRRGTLRCAVFHKIGECCHYGDEEVREPRPAQSQETERPS